MKLSNKDKRQKKLDRKARQKSGNKKGLNQKQPKLKNNWPDKKTVKILSNPSDESKKEYWKNRCKDKLRSISGQCKIDFGQIKSYLNHANLDDSKFLKGVQTFNSLMIDMENKIDNVGPKTEVVVKKVGE